MCLYKVIFQDRGRGEERYYRKCLGSKRMNRIPPAKKAQEWGGGF